MPLVLFDLNNVLFSYHKQSRIDYLARLSGRSAADVEAAIWTSGFEDLSDAGTSSAEEYLREFGTRIGLSLGVDAWTEALKASVAPLPEALGLAERVGRVTPVAVLTNNNLLVRQQIDAIFPELRPIFGDRIYVSAEFQARKPDPLVFQKCLARLGVEATDALFVDDSAANVAGAEQAGLTGLHFNTVAGLETALMQVGLL